MRALGSSGGERVPKSVVAPRAARPLGAAVAIITAAAVSLTACASGPRSDLTPRAAAQTSGYERQSLAMERIPYVGPASARMGKPRLYRAATPPQRPALRPDSASLPSGWLTQPEFLPDRRPLRLGANPAPAPPSATTGDYRIQAAAFASRANADRAAARLAEAGQTEVVPTERGGVVLYRVIVRAADPAEAGDLRDRVARLGYPDARVIGLH